eukprot:5763850-Prymnesium_polylepis.1
MGGVPCGGERQMAASARACRMPVPRVHAFRQPASHRVASVRAPCPTRPQPPTTLSRTYVKRAVHASTGLLREEA